MRVKVGMIGSAGGRMSEEALNKSYSLGKAIAEKDCVIVTGGRWIYRATAGDLRES